MDKIFKVYKEIRKKPIAILSIFSAIFSILAILLWGYAWRYQYVYDKFGGISNILKDYFHMSTTMLESLSEIIYVGTMIAILFIVLLLFLFIIYSIGVAFVWLIRFVYRKIKGIHKKADETKQVPSQVSTGKSEYANYLLIGATTIATILYFIGRNLYDKKIKKPKK